jgi:hypothetical protein
MRNYLLLITSESKNATFDFIHHSTSSTIQLIKTNEDGSIENDIWMDYNEFEELYEFLNKLFKHKK